MTAATHGARVVVLGAGVAGVVTSLLLARAGHTVTLLDRDPPPPEGEPDRVFDEWARGGVGQFRQPHNFLGLARNLLSANLPDVVAALLGRGAWEIDQGAMLAGLTGGDGVPGGASAGEPLPVLIACRRPVFDAVLHAAVRRQPGVEVEANSVVTDLVVGRGRVQGVQLADGRSLEADLVVDALGRTSPCPGWIAEHRLADVEEEQSECGLLYYSRHFRFRPGQQQAPASILYGPRGGLGHLGYAAFMGDNDTFSSVVMVAPDNKPFRRLREVPVYEQVTARIPVLSGWVDPETAEPLTDVLPMGQLRNTWRRWQGRHGGSARVAVDR